MRISAELRDQGKFTLSTADLPKIPVPTLVIGAHYDTMDPAWMEKMSKLLPHGRYLYCPNSGHFAMYGDQALYMQGLIDFLRDVDREGSRM